MISRSQHLTVSRSISAIGLMSGTSLDGLDICLCRFTPQNEQWQYEILTAETMAYPGTIKTSIATAQHLNALQFAEFHSAYGRYTGQTVKQFMDKHSATPDIIASHGHTIFHRPDKGFTVQIGSGAHIAVETGVDTVCDFRTTDVAAGGQGAPLVPIGDRLLFGHYDYCLNIGGFANISYESGGQRMAYDICPANYVMNHYTRSIGLDYDKDGALAARGQIDASLLAALNQLDFYTQNGPKSLGREWVEAAVLPLIDRSSLSLEDQLCTFCEHVAMQTGHATKAGTMLVTGGGAFNLYLIKRIQAHSRATVHIPDQLTVNYKEALIFAFLGILYMNGQANCLASVTGARRNVIGGALYKANFT